jgi:hypothetical protein
MMAPSILVSPPKNKKERKENKHPLWDLSSCWNECTAKEKESFDLQPYRDAFEAWLTRLCLSGPCLDLQNNKRYSKCTCLNNLELSDAEVAKLF